MQSRVNQDETEEETNREPYGTSELTNNREPTENTEKPQGKAAGKLNSPEKRQTQRGGKHEKEKKEQKRKTEET